MKKIVSVLTFLFFLIFSNSLLAEVDIELLKQKYPKCENENYRHECFDQVLYSDIKEIGYYRNNSLWDGQYFTNDILIFEYIRGEQILRSFCEEKDDGWIVCPSGNKSKAFDGGYYDSEGRAQGKFITEYSDGSKHLGEWKDNLKHGQGTMTWVSGSKYEGEYKNDNRHGQGTYTFSSGNKYVGEFKEGVKHGQGTLNFTSGAKYEGEWKDDKYHGQGTYTFADGSKDVGEWKNNTLNGYAIQYTADGTIRREGIFKEDEFLYAETREKKETSKLDKYKSTCEEIGFTPGTEKFGDCVMKLMDKD